MIPLARSLRWRCQGPGGQILRAEDKLVALRPRCKPPAERRADVSDHGSSLAARRYGDRNLGGDGFDEYHGQLEDGALVFRDDAGVERSRLIPGDGNSLTRVVGGTEIPFIRR